MKNRESGIAQYVALLVVGAVAAGAVFLSSNLPKFNSNTQSNAAVLAEATTEFTLGSSSAIANQDGSSVTVGATKAWLGTGQNASQSYLGMYFTGGNVPAGAQIKSATIDLTAVGAWISVGSTFYGDASNGGAFSTSSKPSTRTLTSANKAYSDNVKWEANKTYSYDVTDPVKELVGTGGKSALTIIAKGTGGPYGRKEIYGNPSTGKSPKLRITYSVTTASSSPQPTSTGNVPRDVPPSTSPTGSAKPTVSPTLTPTLSPTATPIVTVAPTATPVTGGTDSIYGVVSTDILGTCSVVAHDKYVTRGPDGVLYRTWHPQKESSGCTYAHEHGDNPATSTIFAGAVPFNYVPHLAGMDEPHAGFKCFVHNKGLTNDEGGPMLHDAYFCFHMGTGGAARFTARFHSMEFHIVTSKGARMDVVGLADTGNVGTICDNPRQQRTVMGFGCKIDSGYEIWENKFNIVNKGNTIASAVTSTAAFDSISVMDPADKTKLIYAWDPLASSQIFKFNDPRQNNRGCEREAYSGPVAWYNRGGTQTYYTDVYGNVVNGGPVKQTISTSNTSDAGPLTQFGGLTMAYKGGNINDPQTQFKYRRSACASGLGLKN